MWKKIERDRNGKFLCWLPALLPAKAGLVTSCQKKYHFCFLFWGKESIRKKSFLEGSEATRSCLFTVHSRSMKQQQKILKRETKHCTSVWKMKRNRGGGAGNFLSLKGYLMKRECGNRVRNTGLEILR